MNGFVVIGENQRGNKIHLFDIGPNLFTFPRAKEQCESCGALIKDIRKAGFICEDIRFLVMRVDACGPELIKQIMEHIKER